MTRVTDIVCRDIRWYRQAKTTVHQTCVTPIAARLWFCRTLHVLRVIKLHIETFFKSGRKAFQWRSIAVHIGVTDRAHRNLRRSELTDVTVLARTVAWKLRGGRVICSLVTRITAE